MTALSRKHNIKRIFRATTAVFLVLCLMSQAMLVHPAKAGSPTVVINELMWMGSSTSSADEWIELRNLTDQPVDLSNWQLTKKSSGAEVVMLVLPAGASILADGFFVISNYAETNASSVLAVTPNHVSTDVALANSALQIKLYDGNHALMDTTDDGVGNPLAGNFSSATKTYVSMERNSVPGDGTLNQNWHNASQAFGFKLGSPELGTPGAMNSNAVPIAVAGPDQTATVGQVVNFDGSDSTDPEGQPLTYAWNFGDGQSGTGATPQHMYGAAGVYSVGLNVSDGIDQSTDSVKVTVTSAPAAPITSPTTPEPLLGQEGAGITSCRGLRLSEIFPNPTGIDTGEFIEIDNAGDEDVEMKSCQLSTSATKKFTFPEGTLVVGQLMIFQKSQTKLTLTNTSGTVRLLDIDGTELDRISYTTAPEGASFSRIHGQWSWTASPTPGKVNVAAALSEKKTTKKTAVTKKAAKAKKVSLPPQPVSLPEIQQLDSGDRVIVQGIVTSTIGALGSTLTTIQSDTGGVTVSVPNGTGPFIIGETVEITGTVKLYQGRRRMAVESNGVRVLDTTATLQAQSIATNDVGADQADQLVHLKGTVALASGNSVDIDDGSGPMTVYIKSSTGIVRPKMKMGDTLEVSGIVGVSTSGIRVFPRSQNDLHLERVLGAATTAAPTILPSTPTHQTPIYWLFIGLGALSAAVRPALNAWKKKRRPS